MLNLKAQHLVLQANPSEQSHWCCSESCQITVHRLALEMPDPFLGDPSHRPFWEFSALYVPLTLNHTMI